VEGIAAVYNLWYINTLHTNISGYSVHCFSNSGYQNGKESRNKRPMKTPLILFALILYSLLTFSQVAKAQSGGDQTKVITNLRTLAQVLKSESVDGGGYNVYYVDFYKYSDSLDFCYSVGFIYNAVDLKVLPNDLKKYYFTLDGEYFLVNELSEKHRLFLNPLGINELNAAALTKITSKLAAKNIMIIMGSTPGYVSCRLGSEIINQHYPDDDTMPQNLFPVSGNDNKVHLAAVRDTTSKCSGSDVRSIVEHYIIKKEHYDLKGMNYSVTEKRNYYLVKYNHKNVMVLDGGGSLHVSKADCRIYNKRH
jgi:hypothetical protein